ncbi:CBY1-interacting BAR domain-containing protein 2-like isoform X2 [Siniperca chuatsi]|uniref:CBY1-interacting BAR domain-containing protein 2-like isoform X2 n=1 Tax=Siniperca chuatsi TaxID=119488 RepID=UPI001CE0F2D0|nr:CBY1-interacting BAR domain-containing protein 2-like isoform X2 [Siniperca chuatsi]
MWQRASLTPSPQLLHTICCWCLHGNSLPLPGTGENQARQTTEQKSCGEDNRTNMNTLFSRDVQVKSMEQTVKHAEKYLGEMCTLLASYTRKTAKIRDKADLLVAQLFDFSSTEDPELQTGLKNLAEDLAMVQDYRQAQVERLETRVVAPLKAYGNIIKNKMIDLKKFSTDLNRELKELQKLEKIRLRNPADRQSISQAEVNAQKASNNAQHSIRQLEETITDFQRQKLEDIKRIFTNFITVEMLFHAKVLEVYTHTYHNLEAMNIQKDLELFNGRIKVSDSPAGRLDTPLSSYSSPLMSRYPSPPLASPKGQSLRSMLASTTGQNHRQQHSQYPDTARRSRSTLQCQRGVEEEEELVEEEEQEEETYESEIEEGQHTSRQSYAAQYAKMCRWQK